MIGRTFEASNKKPECLGGTPYRPFGCLEWNVPVHISFYCLPAIEHNRRSPSDIARNRKRQANECAWHRRFDDCWYVPLPFEVSNCEMTTQAIIFLNCQRATPLRIYRRGFYNIVQIPSPLERGRRWPTGRMRGLFAVSIVWISLTALARGTEKRDANGSNSFEIDSQFRRLQQLTGKSSCVPHSGIPQCNACP